MTAGDSTREIHRNGERNLDVILDASSLAIFSGIDPNQLIGGRSMLMFPAQRQLGGRSAQ